jgi:hypothetical protein
MEKLYKKCEMNIIIFTIDDTRFTPILLEPTLRKHKDKIKKIYVSKTLFSLNFFWKFGFKLLKYGYPWCIKPADLIRFFRKKLFRWGKYPSIENFLEKFGFKSELITTLNGENIRSELASLDPDVFIFCPFDKIAGPKFLEIPKIGTYNVHLGKLPQYKGGYSSFWVLRFNDQTGGSSIHKAVPELDAGELLAEVEKPVRKKSMDSLMLDTVTKTGEMVSQFIDDLENKSLQPIETSGRPSGYYYIPDKKDFKEFYKLNCRLI